MVRHGGCGGDDGGRYYEFYVSTGYAKTGEYWYILAGVAGTAGTAGTGGALSWSWSWPAACSFALVESCESEAWRKRIRLKRLVLGVCSCTGGEGGESAWWPVEGRAMSDEVGR